MSGEGEPSIGARAAGHFASASRRATARIDLRAAASLLGRAIALLDKGDPTYPELLWEWGVVLNRQGLLDEAAPVLTEALTLAAASTTSAWSTERGWTFGGPTPIGPRRAPAGDMGDEVMVLIPKLERSATTSVSRRRGNWWRSYCWRAGQVEAMREPLGRALVHARRADDRLEENEVVTSLLFADRYGPATPADMLARFAEVAGEGVDDRRFEAQVLGCEAVTRAMLGDFESARTLLDRYRAIVSDLGIIYVEYWLAETTWTVEMLAGDAVAAEAGIRIAEGSTARPMDEPVESAVGSRLAHALLVQGRYEEAAAALGVEGNSLDRSTRESCGCRRVRRWKRSSCTPT